MTGWEWSFNKIIELKYDDHKLKIKNQFLWGANVQIIKALRFCNKKTKIETDQLTITEKL